MTMQNHSTHKSASGFTLIELLIVIAIIGILSAIAIHQFNQYKIRGYDAHSKQALKDMHLLCNAYWLDTDALQGCDLPKIKEVTYGFNQNADVVATLPPSPLDNFCASAKHNRSPQNMQKKIKTLMIFCFTRYLFMGSQVLKSLVLRVFLGFTRKLLMRAKNLFLQNVN